MRPRWPRHGRRTFRSAVRFDDLFPLLESLYRSTVDDFDPEAGLKADIDSVEYHLTTHLMSFMWRGVAGAEGLARELMLRGGESVRHAAFDFIGRSLMNAEEEVPAEPLPRLGQVNGRIGEKAARRSSADCSS